MRKDDQRLKMEATTNTREILQKDCSGLKIAKEKRVINSRPFTKASAKASKGGDSCHFRAKPVTSPTSCNTMPAGTHWEASNKHKIRTLLPFDPFWHCKFQSLGVFLGDLRFYIQGEAWVLCSRV